MNPTLIISLFLIVPGGLLAFANWWWLYLSYHTKRNYSPVPFFGAALLGIGMFNIPVTRPLCWMAVVLDYGTLAFIMASPRLAQELWNTSCFNLVREYSGQAGIKTVYLRLFRRGIFTIRLEVKLPPAVCGLSSRGNVGTWQRDGTRLKLQIGRESSVYDVVTNEPMETLRQSIGFPSWEISHESSLAGIDFVLTRGRGEKT
jgi:hypothetical protein